MVPVGLQHAAHGSPWARRALISAVSRVVPQPRAHIAPRPSPRPRSPLQGGYSLKKEGNAFFSKTAQALGGGGKASSEPLPVLPSDSPAAMCPPCHHWGLRGSPVLVCGATLSCGASGRGKPRARLDRGPQAFRACTQQARRKHGQPKASRVTAVGAQSQSPGPSPSAKRGSSGHPALGSTTSARDSAWTPAAGARGRGRSRRAGLHPRDLALRSQPGGPRASCEAASISSPTHGWPRMLGTR